MQNGYKIGNKDQQCRMSLINRAAPSSSDNCIAITWENLRTHIFPLILPLLINWHVLWFSLKKTPTNQYLPADFIWYLLVETNL